MVDTNTCWYIDKCIDSMNYFYDKSVKGRTIEDLSNQFYHLSVFQKLINSIDDKNLNLIDLGCGTGMISQFCKNHNYKGSDLPNVLMKSAMRNYPEHYYRNFDLTDVNQDASWLKDYDIIVVNGVIDIMQYPLQTFERILQNASKYIILHRQEITQKGETHVIKNDSYDGYTYHSIINVNDFKKLLKKYNFEVVMQERLEFTNWEDDGASFLIRKERTWSLYQIDHKLTKYFGNIEDGQCIEIGSNDGLKQSNTYYFEFYQNWHALLIEPIPEIFNKCVENRSRASLCINCAIVGKDYKEKEIEMIYTPESNGLLSVVNDENAPYLMKRTKEEGIKIKVPAYTLNEILQLSEGKFGKHYNFMSIDVEGYERNVLSSVDFGKYIIDYILVEELEENSVIETLLSSHYTKIDKLTEHDYLYKRK